MSEVNFNKINLIYKGYKISIVQYTGDNKPWLDIQEVAFWPENSDPKNAEMLHYSYGKSLKSFMQTMQIVMEDIDNLTKSED